SARETLEPRRDERPLDEAQLVAIGRDIRVGRVSAETRLLETGRDVAELLAHGLDPRLEPRPRGDLREARAIGRERLLQLARGEPPTGHRQPAPERVDTLQMMREREPPLLLERGPRDLGGDVGVAVAVAADPGPPAEERADLERLSGEAGG